jgi:hypothetical protein
VDQDIHLADASGVVVSETVNGDLTLQRIESDSVDVSTVNGEIFYEGSLRTRGVYRFTSHNGDIAVAIPMAASATVNVSTFSGEFASDFPVTLQESRPGRRYCFTLGKGGARVDLESFQGTIHVFRPGTRGPVTDVESERMERLHERMQRIQERFEHKQQMKHQKKNTNNNDNEDSDDDDDDGDDGRSSSCLSLFAPARKVRGSRTCVSGAGLWREWGRHAPEPHYSDPHSSLASSVTETLGRLRPPSSLRRRRPRAGHVRGFIAARQEGDGAGDFRRPYCGPWGVGEDVLPHGILAPPSGRASPWRVR